MADGEDIQIGDITGSEAVAIGRDAMAVKAGRDATVYKAGRDQHFWGSPEGQRERRNQLALLEMVRKAWIDGVLERSPHAAAFIELDREVDTDGVTSSWDVVVEHGDQPRRPLPTGKRLIELFDEMGGALLILGEPGGGKTTMLLDMARAAIARARGDPLHPLPVVLNLSSWEGGPLADWLVNELQQTYSLGRELARQWVGGNELLLLLDGLDEVGSADRQAACVAAINHFRREHGTTKLVVCSRSDDYWALPERLVLGGAVVLQPLREAQINEYLSRLGPDVAVLREALRQSTPLHQLAAIPLWLNVMVLAYRGVPTEVLPVGDTSQGLTRKILDTYVDRMLDPEHVLRSRAWWRVRPGSGSPSSRGHSPQRYPRGQSLRWLRWLANTMVETSQAVVHPDDLGPEWLTRRVERRRYELLHGTIAALVPTCVLTSALALPLASVIWLVRGAPSIVLGGTVFALAFGLVFALVFGRLRGLVLGLGIGLIFGLALQFVIERVGGATVGQPSLWVVLAFACGVVVGAVHMFGFGVILGACLAGGLLAGLAAGLTGGIVGGLGGSLVGSVAGGLVGGVAGGVVLGFVGGLTGGLEAGQLASKIIEREAGVARSTWEADRFAILGGLAGGLGGGLVGALASSSGTGLAIALGAGAIAGLVFGAFTSIVSREVSPLVTGPIAGVLVGATFALSAVVAVWLIYGLTVGLAMGLSIGLAAQLDYHGETRLQRLIVRLVLLRAGVAPFRYSRFLDYATERLILQRVGGSYIFVHGLLMEYFASLYEAEQERS